MKPLAAIAAAIAALLFSRQSSAASAAPSSSSTRLLRLNNPLGIRKTPQEWLGEVESSDPDYEAFGSAEDGIRAGARLLRNYWRLHSLNTVRGIITRWAPPSENPTDAYIRNVSTWTGFAPDQRLDMESDEVIAELVAAIIRQENGFQPFTREMIRAQVARAF